MATRDKKCVDPAEARFYRAYPRFPGVSVLLTLLRNGKAKGVWIDLICEELRQHAPGTIDELITAFELEPDA